MANPEIIKTIDGLLRLEDKKPFTSGEENTRKSLGLVEVIYRRLTSTKFRKTRVGPDTEKIVRDYLTKAINNNEPLRIYYLFGGYKQPRLKSAPFPEWAEIFNLNFSCLLAGALESIYPPGLEIIFRGDDVIVTLLNNIKRQTVKLTQRASQ